MYIYTIVKNKIEHKFPLYVYLLFTYIFANCSHSESEGVTEIQINKKVANIGKVKLTQEKFFIFEIKNVGNKDLKIEEVNTDCFCTVAKWPKKPVPVGGTVPLRITYNTQELGYFQRAIKLRANTHEKITILIMRGKII